MSRPEARPATWHAALGLCVLAPIVAELVGSGNVPTLLFLNPLVALLLTALYGPPALLLREVWVRGRVGWPSMLVLGFAFSALDEGIVADTWFKPNALHMTARELGRAGHVNWNLVASLVVFHTFVSMFVSIALAELWFADRAGKPWLGRRGIVGCALVPVFVAVGNLSTRKDGRPRVVADRAPRATTLLVVVVAVALALVLPRLRIHPSQHRVPRPRRTFTVGFTWFATYLFTFFGLVRLAPRAVPVAALALWGVAVVLVLRWAGARTWTRRHTLLLCAGVLAPSMLLTSWRVLVLQPLSSALFVWWLVRLDRRLRAGVPG